MIVAFSVSVSGQGSAGPDAASGSADGTAEGSVSHAVAAAVEVVRGSGLDHRTSSMFTEIEGEWDEVMAVVKNAVDAVAPYGARISLVLKADIRPGRTGEIEHKIARVEQALAERQ
ncbi:thiamine-binding protein [Citricoccus sp. NR2]|uniref:thiamine-binding protein n=1 Tax=Citricoccus sp. NR2 TaxID=3004095 RepID=UPI0022DD343B|nr:thiamine-binding protein [Citricoccus sp. NR2]WBL19580.1 thiamine-binding protein [Citricoccus sp. NR2]